MVLIRLAAYTERWLFPAVSPCEGCVLQSFLLLHRDTWGMVQMEFSIHVMVKSFSFMLSLKSK